MGAAGADVVVAEPLPGQRQLQDAFDDVVAESSIAVAALDLEGGFPLDFLFVSAA